MSLLDYGEGAAAAPRYIEPPKPEPKFSAWGLATAVPRGIGEAGAQVLGSAADLWGAVEYMRDTPTKDMPAGMPATAFSSEFGDILRDRGRSFRPDPQTASAAESLLYGFARGAAKIVGGAVLGGPAGVVLAGAEEAFSQSDELRRQGVTDPNVRAKAGIVQGAGLAAAALPVVGQSLKATAALYVAGGPGGFIAQQALTRKVLADAGYQKQAADFDPFDPVGLAVASLIPAAFAAWGIRGQKIAAAKAAEDAFMRGDVPSVHTEVADAARVALMTEQRQASNPMFGADVHEAALARAEQQMAMGERVDVADVVSAISAAERDANFKAWFGESKVVDEAGAPMVVYHGTISDVPAFEPSRAGQVGEDFGRALYFTSDPGVAGSYSARWVKSPEFQAVRAAEDAALNAWGKAVVAHGKESEQAAAAKAALDAASAERRRIVGEIEGMQRPVDGANVVPTYLALRNPLEVDARGQYYFKVYKEAFAQARADGRDGIVFRNVIDSANTPNQRPADVYVAFDPTQVKSAIGNSGRFDPNSASLTDPLTQLATALDELQALRNPPEPPSARLPDPEPAAPTPPQGKPRDLRAEVITLRKEQSVLQRLKECVA